MAEPRNCPQCGAALAADAPEGLCRACLLKMGLEANTLPSTDAELKARWSPPAPADLQPKFPDLDILELLGRGGMGAVYKARQKSLDRFVALKILPPEVGQAADFTQRFASEAQAMARLNHPHIVTIYDFGERDGLYFFMMEYADGLSVRQLLNAGRVSSHEALAIVPQICEALQYAHDHGVVHRDIKPENILLNRQGQVKIADFGLAKLVGIDLPAGSADRVLGTPQYMAPEQVARPADVDHRADIYSLGVVFYQLLTGELPSGRIEPPSKKVVIDVRLDEIVMRALDKDPDRRYQQVSEVKTQVESIMSSPGPAISTPVGTLSAPLKTSRGYYTTPEFLATAYGGFWKQQGTGELGLFGDRLVFAGGWQRIEIPFASLWQVVAARGPRWTSPAGHTYLALVYEEGGEEKALLFMPGTGIIRTAHDTREHAGEWIVAIREAYKAATGKELPSSGGTPAVVPASPWGAALVFAPILLFNAIVIWVMRATMIRSGADDPAIVVSISGGAVSLAVGVWFVVLPLWSWYRGPRPAIAALSAKGSQRSVPNAATVSRGGLKGLVLAVLLFPAVVLVFFWLLWVTLVKPGRIPAAAPASTIRATPPQAPPARH